MAVGSPPLSPGPGSFAGGPEIETVGIPTNFGGHKKHVQNHVQGSKRLKWHLCPQLLVQVGLGDPGDKVNVGRLTIPRVTDANPSCKFDGGGVGSGSSVWPGGSLLMNIDKPLKGVALSGIGNPDQITLLPDDERSLRRPSLVAEALPVILAEDTVEGGLHGAGVNVVENIGVLSPLPSRERGIEKTKGDACTLGAAIIV